MITTLIILYFAINIFVAGAIFGEEWGRTWGWEEKASCIFEAIWNIFLFIPRLCAVIVFGLLWELIQWTTIPFWREHYLTKKHDNLSDDLLTLMNEQAKRRKGRGFSDTMFRIGTRALNKRNGFTPPATSDNKTNS